ncbi:MAG: hypothetical protein H7145_11110 [Akkermansiaceae bacterium]|nr:hypothetical protein [Armatimonadota bacterium]
MSPSRVQVTWQASPDVPPNNIVEYHVFRDGQLIGSTPPVTTQYFDSTTPSGELTYNRLDGTVLTSVTAMPPTLVTGMSHIYSVTVLFRDGKQFRETSIGSTTDSLFVP